MALITFMSDFGHRDHYVAAVKAKILAVNHNVKVIDINHEIEPYNIAHAAFVCNAVFRDFPKGTVHILAVNSLGKRGDKYLAIKLEDHYFVGTDNGLFSLISRDKPTAIVELPGETSSFPERDVFAKAAVFLANEKSIYDLGIQIPEVKRMLNRELRLTQNQITGNVLHIDYYGNVITNIEKEGFETVSANRSYNVKFIREEIRKIGKGYNSIDEGDCAVFFNSNNLLEIAINKGNASQLLGLVYDDQVIIEFD